jgi:hypothetical protein
MMTTERTTANDLRLRSISELLGESFWVPSYQRGYRWGAKEVRALLDDLAAFQAKPGAGSYYCLQPLVVRRRDGGDYELIDGQQRLTTIRLILRAQSDFAKILRKEPFTIQYETRDASRDFLENPTAERASQNVDFHHMWHAYRAIQEWFEARDGSEGLRLVDFLTRPDSSDHPNVRVIWYQLGSGPGEDPTAAFLRLNAGRIQLTSAELIRALLLRAEGSDLEERDRRQLAQEWDLIERRLQDDPYWYFLQSADDPPATRIEYLFDLWASCEGHPADNESAIAPDDPHATFFAFQQLVDARTRTRGDLWRSFLQMSRTLEDWFEHPRLYHLVGFLVATAPGRARTPAEARRAGAEILRVLLMARRNRSATEFERHLRWLAWHRLLGTPKLPAREAPLSRVAMVSGLDERLEKLRYDMDGEGVRRALLLFNVAGLLEAVEAHERRVSTRASRGVAHSDAPRFQFARFKEERWDIEHVRSVAEDRPTLAAARKRWLGHAEEFLRSPSVPPDSAARAKELLELVTGLRLVDSPDTERFDAVFDRVRAISGEPEAREDDDALSNLVLLDLRTNRSYQNAIFPVKRRWIIGLDREGTYVPPATRNVFLKYYTPEASQLLLWSDSDQEAYGREIRETLLRFFTPIAAEEACE